MNGREEICRCSDVSCLLLSLRLARNHGDVDTQRAVVDRLRNLGLLQEPNSKGGEQFVNLSNQVNSILGVSNDAQILSS
jgi:hypothetical protein